MKLKQDLFFFPFLDGPLSAAVSQYKKQLGIKEQSQPCKNRAFHFVITNFCGSSLASTLKHSVISGTFACAC